MNTGVIKSLLTMVSGFALIAIGFATALAAKLADPNAWMNEVVAIGHAVFFGVIGSDLIGEGWQSFKNAWAGPEQSVNKKRRTSARRA